MKVGEYIKKARLSAGITQTELAKRLNTTPQNISQYETGKRIPKLSTLEKLSEAIGIPLVSKIIHDPDIYSASIITGKNGSELKLEYKTPGLIFPEITEPYKKLNAAGKQKAVDFVEDLTDIPKYQKENENVPDPEK